MSGHKKPTDETTQEMTAGLKSDREEFEGLKDIMAQVLAYVAIKLRDPTLLARSASDVNEALIMVAKAKQDFTAAIETGRELYPKTTNTHLARYFDMIHVILSESGP